MVWEQRGCLDGGRLPRRPGKLPSAIKKKKKIPERNQFKERKHLLWLMVLDASVHRH